MWIALCTGYGDFSTAVERREKQCHQGRVVSKAFSLNGG